MQKNTKKYGILTGTLFLAFLLFTILVKIIDVQPIGPKHSRVGFATLNQFLFEFIGVNQLWSTITDCLGVAALMIALGFAILGLIQLVKSKSLKQVDIELLLLGVCYILLLISYFLFEQVIINYRPILIDQSLEASYPSSHVMLVLGIMATARPAFHHYLSFSRNLQRIANCSAILLTAITIIGRLLSGVHWFTDILAAILLAAAIASLYYTILTAYKQLRPHHFSQ